ncbi:MAG: hypothetical protein AB7E47_14015 [Desulfovibrionaceae bacterium]
MDTAHAQRAVILRGDDWRATQDMWAWVGVARDGGAGQARDYYVGFGPRHVHRLYAVATHAPGSGPIEALVTVRLPRIAHGRALAGYASSDAATVYKNLLALFPRLAGEYLDAVAAGENGESAAWAREMRARNHAARPVSADPPATYAAFREALMEWACVGPGYGDEYGSHHYYVGGSLDGGYTLYDVRIRRDGDGGQETLASVGQSPLRNGREVAALGDADPEACYEGLRRHFPELAAQYLDAVALAGDEDDAAWARGTQRRVRQWTDPEAEAADSSTAHASPASPVPPEAGLGGPPRSFTVTPRAFLDIKPHLAWVGDTPVVKTPSMSAHITYYVGVHEDGAPCLLEITAVADRDTFLQVCILEVDAHVAHGEAFAALCLQHQESYPTVLVERFPRLAMGYFGALKRGGDGKRAAWARKCLERMAAQTAAPAPPCWRDALVVSQPQPPSPHQPAYEAYLASREQWVCLDTGHGMIRGAPRFLHPVYLGMDGQGAACLFFLELAWNNDRKERLEAFALRTEPVADGKEIARRVKEPFERVYWQIRRCVPALAQPYVEGLLAHRAEDRACVAWAEKTLAEHHGWTPPAPALLFSSQGQMAAALLAARCGAHEGAASARVLDLDDARPVFDGDRQSDARARAALLAAWEASGRKDPAAASAPPAAVEALLQRTEHQLDNLVRDTYDALPPSLRRQLRTAFEKKCITSLALGVVYREEGFGNADMRNLFAAFLTDVLAPVYGWTTPRAIREAYAGRKK